MTHLGKNLLPKIRKYKIDMIKNKTIDHEIDETLKFYDQDTIIDVFKKINLNEFGACFYVSDTGKLLGVLTDGDIRRALIKENSIQNITKIWTIKEAVYKAFGQPGIDFKKNIII